MSVKNFSAFLLGLFITGFIPTSLQAQSDTLDPFLGHYKLLPSSELVFFGKDLNIYDFHFEEDNIILESVNSEIALEYNQDACVGNFTGDLRDELLLITVKIVDSQEKTCLSLVEFTDDELTPTVSDSVISSIKGVPVIVSGNFNDDYNDEFVIAWWDRHNSQRIILELFDVQDGKIVKLDSISDVVLSSEAGYQVFFDMAAASLDNDILDEIVLVHVGESGTEEGYYLKTFDIEANKIKLDGRTSFTAVNKTLYQLVVASGRINSNASADIMVGIARDPNAYLYRHEVLEESIGDAIEIYTLSTARLIISSQSLSLADLNLDGLDEVMFSFYGKTVLLTPDGSGNFTSLPTVGGSGFNWHRSRRTLAADFVKADTATGKGTAYLFQLRREGPSAGMIEAWKVNTDEQNLITGLSKTGIGQPFPSGNFSWEYHNGCGLLLGDFDGDGLLLGNPKKYVAKGVIVPSIIMNAPPSHYDILEGQTYDVSMLYVDVDHRSDSYSQYMENSEEEQTSTSQLNRDWGVSSKTKAGGKIFKIGVEATLTASYGEEFSRMEQSTKSVKMQKETKAQKDDRVYGMTVDYHLWEYPVFWQGKSLGTTLVSVPVLKGNTWSFSRDLNFNKYALTHEPGNLLSYPCYESISQNPYLTDGELNGAIFQDRFALSNEFSSTWTLNLSSLESNSLSKTRKFNLGLNVSASGIGWSTEVQGDFSQANMNSHETIIKNELEIRSNFDKIDKSIGEVEFELQPYVYWSGNGALNIDYNVDLTGKWWMDHYGQKPDPAFIMPFRYGPEKGNNFDNESKRLLTSDIRYSPFNAIPGDTIEVMTTIRNFSLMDMDEEFDLRFYLGDPDQGGTPLDILDGDSEFTIDPIPARQFTSIKFRYLTPETIPANPWIFAVIDPEDEIDEIHSNNNKGFICLFTDDYPPYTASSINNNAEAPPAALSLYPNPATNETHIRFSLEQEQSYTLCVFNQLGMLIESKEVALAASGRQDISMDTSGLPAGLYFVRINLDNKDVSARLMILR